MEGKTSAARVTSPLTAEGVHPRLCTPSSSTAASALGPQQVPLCAGQPAERGRSHKADRWSRGDMFSWELRGLRPLAG